MENIRDWCISRQIWWGHRIPVFTCSNGHVFVHRGEPDRCPDCGDDQITQDPDVLDTWFSSWLWPFSTLGWPEKTKDLEVFFPTQTLATGPDIIFFWVARMIMSSLEFMGEVPFSDVYFNGMIRDLSGKTMSKSLGNSPDPLWLIESADKDTVAKFASKNPTYKKGVPAYGADAIRLTMVYLTPLGGDIHFDHTLVEFGQKFCNKLWNASRFVLMNLDDDQTADLASVDPSSFDLADRWILSRLQNATAEIRKGMETYRFNDSTRSLYGFVWGEFCDWYLELVKSRLYGDENPEARKTAQAVVLHILDAIVKLLHPFMPFITEEIWQALPNSTAKPGEALTIMKQAYPTVQNDWVNDSAEKEMALIQDTIGVVRNIRGEMNVPQDRKASVVIRGPQKKLNVLTMYSDYIKRLASVESMEIGEKIDAPPGSATGLVQDLEVFVPLGGLIDLDVEKERISKEIVRMEGLLTGLSRKLTNTEFIQKAPAEVVEKEKQKQSDFLDKLKKLKNNLSMLDG